MLPFAQLAPPARCNLPMDSGPCLKFFIKYFYDPSKSDCSQFVYGGCGGNANLFFDYQECHETCVAA
ncbi:hypothetical protein Avbf_16542 [Armadillidium vulgare]|nr:hypothetical protein Avbf_16542 [Armadillidium vulgare]